MRVGLHLRPQLFGTRSSTPVLTVSQKKLLQRSVAVLLLVEINVLAFSIFQKSDIGEAQASVIRRVFAQSQLAVHLRVVNRGKAAVLFYFAVGFLLKLPGIVACPPFSKIPVPVKLSPVVVEAVGEFVPHNCAD